MDEKHCEDCCWFKHKLDGSYICRVDNELVNKDDEICAEFSVHENYNDTLRLN